MGIRCRHAFDFQPAGLSFPYLYDETQDVAKKFDAVCTPDIYLYDTDQRLQYRGQFDDSRPSSDQAPTCDHYSPALLVRRCSCVVNTYKPLLTCPLMVQGTT